MEARPKGASFCWKFSQVSLYLIAFACAIVAAVTLGVTVQKFDGRCPLYTDGGAFFTITSDSNSTINGVDDASIWQGRSTCDFSIFVPVAGATFGFVLAYFVIMFDTAHDVDVAAVTQGGLERLQKNRMPGLFLPLFFASLLLTVMMLISSVRTLNGTNVFCDGIQSALDLSCQEAQDLTWKTFPFVDNFYTLMLTSVAHDQYDLAQISNFVAAIFTLLHGVDVTNDLLGVVAMITTWISSTTFLLSIVLLLLRCFFDVDFDPSTRTVSKRAVRSKAGHRKLSRTESQRSLLPAMEPLPGTSAEEPQFVQSPGSAGIPLTVIP